MKKLFEKISESEKNRILEMHKRSGKQNYITEQPTNQKKTKLIKNESFLWSNSPSINTNLGLDFLPPCFEGLDSHPVSSSEIDDYEDYLGVYGKVPGTGIPIPYQGSDLQYMLQLLQGSGTPAAFGGNYNEVGPIYLRWFEKNGLYYPVVEQLRVSYKNQTGNDIVSDLRKRMTDSKEDIEKKKEILDFLNDAYRYWIDCAAGIKKSRF